MGVNGGGWGEVGGCELCNNENANLAVFDAGSHVSVCDSEVRQVQCVAACCNVLQCVAVVMRTPIWLCLMRAVMLLCVIPKSGRYGALSLQ